MTPEIVLVLDITGRVALCRVNRPSPTMSVLPFMNLAWKMRTEALQRHSMRTSYPDNRSSVSRDNAVDAGDCRIAEARSRRISSEARHDEQEDSKSRPGRTSCGRVWMMMIKVMY